jgi:methyl-accepting chemotaxis protein
MKKLLIAITFIRDYVGEVNLTLLEISNGNLTVRINRDYMGDFVSMKDSINHIGVKLHDAISEISSASDHVLTGAQQISQAAMHLSEGSTKQFTSVEELNTALSTIRMQTQENNNNTDLANELSEKSITNAKESNVAMAQMLEAMGEIRTSSNDIGHIVKTIQDIAFQTNLLALNASVEAARAGEHGKGFAVVAEEVRSLAARSQDAASETTNLISDSINRVESGTSIANTTSVSLDAIVKSAGDVMGLIGNITNAAGDQAKMIADISNTLLTTATTVQNNSKFAHESAATAEELNSQAEILQQLVAYFKL